MKGFSLTLQSIFYIYTLQKGGGKTYNFIIVMQYIICKSFPLIFWWKIVIANNC